VEFVRRPFRQRRSSPSRPPDVRAVSANDIWGRPNGVRRNWSLQSPFTVPDSRVRVIENDWALRGLVLRRALVLERSGPDRSLEKESCQEPVMAYDRLRGILCAP